MDVMMLIRAKYGECLVGESLTRQQLERAQELPRELFQILQQGNGIYEVMDNPVTGESMVIGSIVYSLEEILSETEYYITKMKGDGWVFAGDGAGGVYILKPDGRVFLYEYEDVGEELKADSLLEFLTQ